MPPNSQLSTPFAWQALETVRSVEVELGPQATSENSFDSRGHIITQFLSPLQCSLYPDNLQFPGRYLASGLFMLAHSTQASLVTGEHPPEDRDGAFLGLCMGASDTQSFEPSVEF